MLKRHCIRQVAKSICMYQLRFLSSTLKTVIIYLYKDYWMVYFCLFCGCVHVNIWKTTSLLMYYTSIHTFYTFFRLLLKLKICSTKTQCWLALNLFKRENIWKERRKMWKGRGGWSDIRENKCSFYSRAW